MTELVDVVLGGTFHAAVLFLVAAGLQLVFGVQKIVNLACGSFYALGAYFGITAVGIALQLGMPPPLFFPVLIVAGLAIGLVGLPIERLSSPTPKPSLAPIWNKDRPLWQKSPDGDPPASSFCGRTLGHSRNSCPICASIRRKARRGRC